jgi:hypothetical protein
LLACRERFRKREFEASHTWQPQEQWFGVRVAEC